jgi:hypothetical protein
MKKRVFAVVDMTVLVPVRVKRRVIVEVDHRRSQMSAIRRAATGQKGPEVVVNTAVDEITEVGFGYDSQNLGDAVDDAIGTDGVEVKVHGIELD